MNNRQLGLAAGASVLLAFAATVIVPKSSIKTREGLTEAMQVLERVPANTASEFLCWQYDDRDIETTLYFRSTLPSAPDNHVVLINHHGGRRLFTQFSVAAFPTVENRLFSNHSYGFLLESGEHRNAAVQAYGAVMGLIKNENGHYSAEYQCNGTGTPRAVGAVSP